jgi:DNA-binding IclR family transcriptional regulator
VNTKNSGVGVLDKAVSILSTLEAGPHSLAELVAATGIARPTAHRLAVALEFHRLVARDLTGRFVLGPRSGELGAAAGEDRLLAAAAPALSALRDATGESAQLYRRQGDLRICVAVAERLSGLRDSVPVGAALTMQAGSAAQILLAWEDSEAGVASVSAPVRAPNGKVIAAVSISGPIERLGRQPGRIHAAAVVATAARLTEFLARE